VKIDSLMTDVCLRGLKGRNYLGHQGVDEMTGLGWVLEQKIVTVQTASVWLMMGTRRCVCEYGNEHLLSIRGGGFRLVITEDY
jgi:hypothetical protein